MGPRTRTRPAIALIWGLFTCLSWVFRRCCGLGIGRPPVAFRIIRSILKNGPTGWAA